MTAAARSAAVVVLLAVAALGARARMTLPGRSGPFPVGTTVAVLMGVLWVAGAVVLLAVLARTIRWRRRRVPEDAQHQAMVAPPSRAAQSVALLLALAALAVPVVVFALVHRPGGSTGAARPPSPPAPAASSTAPAAPHSARSGSGSAASTAVLIGVAAAAVAAAAAAGTRAGSRRSASDAGDERSETTVDEPGPDASGVDVARVVRRGRDALAEADPAGAIIACYQAMEAELASAGIPRRAAQTPDELLAAAVAAALVDRAPAERLTRLFQRARFSGRPSTADERSQAETTLAVLDEQLHTARRVR
jgi:hypothetical protein